MDSLPTRRRFVRSAASLGLPIAVSIAGCSGTGTDATPTESPDGSSPTPSPATEAPTESETPGETTASPTEGDATGTATTATATGTETPTAGAGSTVVSVVLDGAPNGLRKFKIAVSNAGPQQIEEVGGEIVTGRQFEVVSGGVGETAVTARAVDLAKNVGAFEDARPLFTILFAGDVPLSQLTSNVAILVDDRGDPIDPERIALQIQAQNG